MGNREAALRNLRKANEAKQRKKLGIEEDSAGSACSSGDLKQTMQMALDAIRKKGNLEGENVNYLTNLLKVTSQELRANRNAGDSEELEFRTHEAAERALCNTLEEIVELLRRLPPGGQRYFHTRIMSAFDKLDVVPCGCGGDSDHGPAGRN